MLTKKSIIEKLGLKKGTKNMTPAELLIKFNALYYGPDFNNYVIKKSQATGIDADTIDKDTMIEWFSEFLKS